MPTMLNLLYILFAIWRKTQEDHSHNCQWLPLRAGTLCPLPTPAAFSCIDTAHYILLKTNDWTKQWSRTASFQMRCNQTDVLSIQHLSIYIMTSWPLSLDCLKLTIYIFSIRVHILIVSNSYFFNLTKLLDFDIFKLSSVSKFVWVKQSPL